jgi:hypothetical protein
MAHFGAIRRFFGCERTPKNHAETRKQQTRDPASPCDRALGSGSVRPKDRAGIEHQPAHRGIVSVTKSNLFGPSNLAYSTVENTSLSSLSETWFLPRSASSRARFAACRPEELSSKTSCLRSELRSRWTLAQHWRQRNLVRDVTPIGGVIRWPWHSEQKRSPADTDSDDKRGKNR